MFLFNPWTELEITREADRYARLIRILEEANLPYKETVQHLGHENRRGGRIGGLGENPRYTILYQVFVRKKDLEQAQYLVRTQMVKSSQK